MKKLILALCAASLLLTGTSLAEEVELPANAILVLDPSGAHVDLDGDGGAEWISLSVETDDFEGTYRLRAGDEVAEGTGIGLSGELRVLRLNQSDRAYLLVGEYGESDDPQNYIYRYANGALDYCGAIPSWADSIAITDEGFTATVRGTVIQTWFRRADFIITDNSYFDDATGEYVTAPPVVVEVPRDLYAMGTVVTLKKDVTLQISRTDDTEALTIPAGDQAVIVATDDLQWLYIETLTVDYENPYNSGWLRLADAYDVLVDGEAVMSSDVFNGLLFAD